MVRIRKIALLLALAVALLPSDSLAAVPDVPDVFHVSTTGTDTSSCSTGGTLEHPWGTINHGMRCLTPGDTLYLNGGVYRERVVLNPRPGTAQEPITVAAYPGQQPLVVGMIRLGNADYWQITGIDITSDAGPYDSGQYLLKMRGGTDWQWLHSEIWNAQSYAAVRVEPDGDIAVKRFRLARNCIHDTAATHEPYLDHNMYVHTGSGGSGLIERNVLHSAPNGQNLKLGDPRGGAFNVLVRNNTMHGGAQNVFIMGESSNNVVVHNLLGLNLGKDWYHAVRGFKLTGPGNEGRHNAIYRTGGTVMTGADGGASTEQIYASKNHVISDPGFLSTDCNGFQPADSTAAEHGVTKGGWTGPVPVTGDWNRDNVDTVGWFDTGSYWRLSNRNGEGPSALTPKFASWTDTPVTGDWDGDGRDTIGVVRKNEFLLTNDNGAYADEKHAFGSHTDIPIVGDWDGDGRDTGGVVRGNAFRITNTWGLTADAIYTFGSEGDIPVVGDWDGDGRDSIGVVRQTTFYLTNTFGPYADTIVTVDAPVGAPVIGDWDGDGRDDVGIVHEHDWYLVTTSGAEGPFTFIR